MASSSSSPDSASIIGTSEPLYQVKLLSALRSGDPALIHPFLAEISRDKRKVSEDGVDVGGAALHLAIRCASCETVRLLLSHRSISLNAVHPPGSGTTPLHLAASLGRAEVVELLLDQDDIDDTLRDARGRTCKDVAKGKDVVRVIQDSQALLTASYRSLLRTYIHSPPTSPPPTALLTLLSSPRVRLINLSYLDDASGTTLLHEATRRKDFKLVELAVRAGADVFVRDIRGKAVGHGLPKDDRIRVLLRQFTNQDTTLIDTPSADPPALKGYLNKYTNVARGYNTRWFVLKDGVLSYYRHQQDERIASRGSIAMKTAVLKVAPGGEKLRFEVHSIPTRGSQIAQKWFLRANHPVELSRWTQAVAKSIEWAKRSDAAYPFGGGGHDSASASVSARASTESESNAGHSHGHGHGHHTHTHSATPSMLRNRTASMKGSISGSLIRKLSSAPRDGDVSSLDGGIGTGDESDAVANMQQPVVGEAHMERVPSGRSDERAYDEDDDSGVESSDHPPHEAEYGLSGSSALAQMELTSQLLASLSLPSSASARTVELKSALKESFEMVQKMMGEYVGMMGEREEWWRAKVERERERQAVWEESLQVVVQEGQDLEKELRERYRRRSHGRPMSAVLGAGADGMGTVKQKMREALALQVPSSSQTEVSQSSSSTKTVSTTASPVVSASTPTPASSIPNIDVTTISERTAIITSPTTLVSSPLLADDDAGSANDTDEDEFFDAIESNTFPNLTVNKSLLGPSELPDELPTRISGVNIEPYAGYVHLREKLPISNDQRPSTSLWSVLRHNIGKDLTKITFPVSFNEPTSMLQRMAEDMEFSECLDAAAAETDPHRRIAFVAAFAMSNYSSTIGRIAKPFNPMLGETFEYVRLDKHYRYMSEQVSHHPPISACWAEAPSWHYYGEVDAQNKFMGKSFEIRPTGVAHAELLLPESLGPNYPKTDVAGEVKVIEHYSWKKVTTNVSGFILGAPTIDHYGDMVVTNHRTQDKCILTFKPRGWRGKDAFEITGRIMGADERVTYEIAGRWNSQLVAREVGTGSGYLLPDVSISGPSSPTPTPEYILLWRNTPKPPAPFNLTPFAITLNDCPEDTLKPYICPTDCRLRPDQRAFELGQYDLANELKSAQEDFQRKTRKAREEGRLPPHHPRWFEAATEGDTGERVWTPVRVDPHRLEYWFERERVWKSGSTQPWKNVDNIFIKDSSLSTSH